MIVDDADDLVVFEDVRVIKSTAPALLCAIGNRHVWLPRGHITGKLWCTGDRGKLFVRRWVARDRGLIAPLEIPMTALPEGTTSPRRGTGRLYLVPTHREARVANH